MLPHLADKRAASAQLRKALERLPFAGARLLKLARPMLGPLLRGVHLPPSGCSSRPVVPA